MDALNIHDEIESYRRLTGNARSIVGKRLLRAGVEMDKQIASLASWLEWGDMALAGEYHEGREGKWLEKLHRYERLCDMRQAIREEVLDA